MTPAIFKAATDLLKDTMFASAAWAKMATNQAKNFSSIHQIHLDTVTYLKAQTSAVDNARLKTQAYTPNSNINREPGKPSASHP